MSNREAFGPLAPIVPPLPAPVAPPDMEAHVRYLLRMQRSLSAWSIMCRSHGLDDVATTLEQHLSAVEDELRRRSPALAREALTRIVVAEAELWHAGRHASEPDGAGLPGCELCRRAELGIPLDLPIPPPAA